jgi:hypothetical protein
MSKNQVKVRFLLYNLYLHLQDFEYMIVWSLRTMISCQRNNLIKKKMLNKVPIYDLYYSLIYSDQLLYRS